MDKDQKIIAIIARVLKLKKKDIKKNLKIGDVPSWDSLAHINIFLELKKFFSFNNDITRLSKIKSVEDWINFVFKK